MTSDDGGAARSLSATGPSSAGSGRRFWAVLLVLAVGAVAVRVGYVLAVARDLPLGNDATWYFLQSGSIADGAGYIDPEQRFAVGAEVATAGFPPLFPAWLAVVRALGVDSVLALQLAGAATGAATVVLTGALGRRLSGPTVGLVAAGLAAVSPVLIAADGSLMAETVYVPLVLLTLVAADHARTDGSWGWWLALGAAAGAAALTRQEAIAIVVVVVVPAVVFARDRTWGWRAGRLAAALAVFVVVVTPWIVRNERQLGTAAISTASPATSLAGSNCDATYDGPAIGSWAFSCTGTELRTELPEAAWTAEVRAGAVRYARDHASRLVVVVPAREARVWGIWDPHDLVVRDADETRSRRFQYVVWASGLVTLVAGIAGIGVLARRGGRVAVLVGPLALVGLTAAATYGNPRFRTVAEPVLLVGSAVLVVAVASAGRGRRSSPTRSAGLRGPHRDGLAGGPGADST